MKYLRFLAALGALLIMLASALTPLHAQDIFANKAPSLNNNQTDFLPVEQAYQVTISGTADTIELHWQIAPGYYLYQHAFALLVDDKAADLNYQQAGLAQHDEYFGDVTVFYDSLQQTASHSDASRIAVNYQGCADAGLCYPPQTLYYYFDTASSSWLAGSAAPQPNNSSEPRSLLLLILLALAGGVILNLMPCVLPVLTLKSLSFLKHHSARERIAEGWCYTAGVVFSFTLIGASLFAFKASGQVIGWGFQLQSSLLVSALVYLFFIMGLSLLDAFHIRGPVISGSASHGNTGAFFTGVLACVVASPCTAPFMGAAIGASLALPASAGLLVFIALGFGMALPFLALSYVPQLQRWLPKPGAWMNRLKQALAFPLFATSIWLVHVAAQQFASTTLILSCCLAIAAICWWRKQLSIFAIVGLLIAAIAATAWLQAAPNKTSGDAFQLTQLDQVVGSNERVFVNVTAAWCITCKANERLLYSDDVQQLFEQTGTLYVEADWTNYNADIGRLLQRHNRNGIPLYLYYYKGNIATPTILPQLLSLNDIKAVLATQ